MIAKDGFFKLEKTGKKKMDTCSNCIYAMGNFLEDNQEGECFFNPPLATLAQSQNPLTQQPVMTVMSYRPRINKTTIACGHIKTVEILSNDH